MQNLFKAFSAVVAAFLVIVGLSLFTTAPAQAAGQQTTADRVALLRAAPTKCGAYKTLTPWARFNRGEVNLVVHYRNCKKAGVGKWTRVTDSQFSYTNDYSDVCGPDIFNGYKGVFDFRDYRGRHFRVKYNLDCERDGRAIVFKGLSKRPKLRIGPPLYAGGPRQAARLTGTFTMKLDYLEPDKHRDVSAVFSTKLN